MIYGENQKWPPSMPAEGPVEDALRLLSGAGMDALKKRQSDAKIRQMLPGCTFDTFRVHFEVVELEDSPLFVIRMGFRSDAGKIFFPPAEGHPMVNGLFDQDRDVLADTLTAQWLTSFGEEVKGGHIKPNEGMLEAMHEGLQQVHYRIVTGELPTNIEV